MPDFLFPPTSLPVLNNPMGIGDAKCGICGLYKLCNSPKMPPTGKGQKRILLVSGAPGPKEDDTGVHFTGPMGRMIEGALESGGVNMRRDCWMVDALRCRPQKNSKDHLALEYCRPNLIKTVRELKPELIILFGDKAQESLIKWLWGNGSGNTAQRWAGYQIPAQEINAWVCPTYHPIAIWKDKDDRNPVTELQFYEHVSAALKLKGRPWTKVPRYEDEVGVIFDLTEARKLLKKIKSGDTVAFDYETNCLKPEARGAKLYSAAFCVNDEWTIAFPWDATVMPEVRRILADPLIRKIGANIKFEDRWTLKHLSVRVRGWFWDVNLVAHAMENANKYRNITSVKFQGFVKLGVKDWSKRVDPFLHTSEGGSKINKVHQIGKKELLMYNGLDALIEYRIAKVQMKGMGFEI